MASGWSVWMIRARTPATTATGWPITFQASDSGPNRPWSSLTLPLAADMGANLRARGGGCRPARSGPHDAEAHVGRRSQILRPVGRRDDQAVAARRQPATAQAPAQEQPVVTSGKGAGGGLGERHPPRAPAAPAR